MCFDTRLGCVARWCGRDGHRSRCLRGRKQDVQIFAGCAVSCRTSVKVASKFQTTISMIASTDNIEPGNGLDKRSVSQTVRYLRECVEGIAFPQAWLLFKSV